jgi:hypothetical protein
MHYRVRTADHERLVTARSADEAAEIGLRLIMTARGQVSLGHFVGVAELAPCDDDEVIILTEAVAGRLGLTLQNREGA